MAKAELITAYRDMLHGMATAESLDELEVKHILAGEIVENLLKCGTSKQEAEEYRQTIAVFFWKMRKLRINEREI